MKKHYNYILIRLNKKISWFLVIATLIVLLTGYSLTIIGIQGPLAEWGHRALGGFFALLLAIHIYSSVIILRYSWIINIQRLLNGELSPQALLRLFQRISSWIVAIFGLLMLFSGLDWFKIGTGQLLGFTSHITFDFFLSLAIISHISIGLSITIMRKRKMKHKESVETISISRRKAIIVIGGVFIALLTTLYLDRIPKVPEVIDRIKRILPPGQYEVGSLRILTIGKVPSFNMTSWNLKINGLVKNPITLTYEEFVSLPKISSVSDFHCVTGWTKFGNKWEGVSLKTIIEMVQPKDEAKYIFIICEESFTNEPYTTSLSLEDLDRDDILLAFRLDDQELPTEHGGPLRLVVPHKYGYKSAKWVREIRFVDGSILGFWESRGFSNSADPFTENRYSSSE
jgi:DMSO/TMAO reductase YedYZ molybdopterin-dependent catalytic subunit